MRKNENKIDKKSSAGVKRIPDVEKDSVF